METPGPILGIWAHPDDETYLSGGLMALARERDERVVCVTATKGEEGSQDHERWPPDRLAGVREAELMAALAHLGVEEHHWLGYPDGGCPDVPEDEAVAAVAAIIERVAPLTVLTFGPEGMTGHPDHRTICAWATAAFERAAPAGARLHYATMTPEAFAEAEEEWERGGVFAYGRDGVPPLTEHEGLSIYLKLDGDALAAKSRALRAMPSQVEGLIALVGEERFADLIAEEAYLQAQAR